MVLVQELRKVTKAPNQLLLQQKAKMNSYLFLSSHDLSEEESIHRFDWRKIHIAYGKVSNCLDQCNGQ